MFLLAFGHAVSPIDLLVAYGLANVLAVIPITPGGLGVIEGVLIPTLVGFGVPLGIATLGVLTWRLVNFWLPIPVGGGSYLSLRLGTRARQRRREKSAKAHPTSQTAESADGDWCRAEGDRRSPVSPAGTARRVGARPRAAAGPVRRPAPSVGAGR